MDKRIELKVRGAKSSEAIRVTQPVETVSVKPASTVKIAVSKDALAGMERVGDDLIVKFADGSVVHLEGYFACEGTPDASQLLVGAPGDPSQWAVSLSDAACRVPGDLSSETLDYSMSPATAETAAASAAATMAGAGGMSTGLLAGLGGALLAGGLAAAAGGAGGGNSNNNGNGGGGGNSGGTPPTDTTPPSEPEISAKSARRISGTADPGSTIRIDINGDGTVDATVLADANGFWSYTPASPFAHGTRILITAVDSAGNVSSAETLFIDALPPTAPTVDPSDGLEITGTAEAGSTVSIDINADGSVDGTAIANSAGRWSFRLFARLASGTLVRVTATDEDGNMSVATFAETDAEAPSAPTIQSLTDNAGSSQGAIASGGLTDDPQPTLSGIAEANATISVYDNGALIGTTTADAGGAWSFTPSQPLGDGAHSITATATDEAGNVGPSSIPQEVTVDTQPPGAPTVLPSDGQTISGVADPGSTISVDTNGDGTADASTVADAGGLWSVTLSTQLPGGTVVSVTASDPAGNVSPATTATTDISLDTTPPPVPALGTVQDNVGPLLGLLVSGDVTNDPTPVFAGNGAEPGSILSFYDNITLIGTATVDNSGNWSFAPLTPLAEGTHSLTITATDANGNVSAPSVAFDLTVDTFVPTLTVRPSNGAGLEGTAEAGATVEIDLNGDGTADVSVVADPSGNWGYIPDTRIPDGVSVIIMARDAAGNSSTPLSVLVDQDVPIAPSLTTVSDAVGNPLSPIASGGISNDPLPLLSGLAEPNSTVFIYDNGVLLGTASVDGAGDWTFTPPVSLADGAHVFTVTAADVSGNVSGPSTGYAVTIDTAITPPMVSPSDGITLSGTAESGASIAIDLNGDGNADLTVTADSSGAWSAPIGSVSGALPNGAVVGVVATDIAGNVSTPVSITVTSSVDTTPPPVPSIGQVFDDILPSQLALTAGASTNDTQPLITGSGVELGATISVYDNGTLIGTASVDGSGNWAFTPSAPLGEGAHSLTVTATDANGNESAPSTAFALVVDTLPPAVPTLLPSNGTLLSGTAEAGVTVNIDIGNDGSFDYSVVADTSGAWSFTPSGLANGMLVSVTATDAAGNSSGPSAVITIDTVLPPVPSILGIADDVGGLIGPVLTGGATDDTQPQLSGTAEIGAAVTIFNAGVAIGTSIADSAGAWTFTPSSPLPAGAYNFTATATDASGNASGPSAVFAITIDVSAPAIPAIGGVLDNVGGLLGPLLDGSVTDDPTPELSGTADIGATVTIFDNGVAIGTAIANSSGDWTFTPASPLPSGVHSFTVVASDAAGNASGASGSFTISVDTDVPALPSITSILDDAGGVLGLVLDGGATDDQQPALAGNAEAGATITILDGGSPIGTVTATAAGTWSFVPSSPLSPGNHSFTVTATDLAGNVSSPSAVHSITIDIAAPAIPPLPTIADDVGTILTSIVNGGVTDDTLPVLTGTGAEAGATISVYDNGILIGAVTVDGTGAWSFTPSSPLGEGAHSLTFTATDPVGNMSVASSAIGFTIDTIAPGAPVIAPSNGAALSGLAEPNATITLYVNGSTTPLAVITADGSGNWNYGSALGLLDGTIVTATATDAAGNVSTFGTSTIDAVAPGIPLIDSVTDNVGQLIGLLTSGGSTDDTTPQFVGRAEAGATITLFDGSTQIGTTTVDASGSWSFTPSPPLSAGAHSITVTATDAVGNSSGASAAFNLDVAIGAATAPAITGVADDVAGGTVGAIAGGGLTNDALPAISGTGSIGATITIYDNGAAIGVATVGVGGTWSFTPSAPLADGAHSFTAVAVDLIGRVSAASPAFAITIDATAPLAPVIVSAADDVAPVTGTVGNNGVTNDAEPAFSGTAEAGATVSLYQGATLIGTTTADGFGAWTITPSTPLSDGVHSLTAVATDAAGNSGPASTVFTVTVDTIPPAQPTLNPSNGGTLTGTAEAGAIVRIDTGAGTVDVTADQNGNWSYTATPALANGTIVSVIAIDAAGNLSAPSATISVDSVPPPAPAIQSLTDDAPAVTGTFGNGVTTNDTEPRLSGTAEPNALVTLFEGGVQVGTATADGSGNWTFTFAAPLPDGQHVITATARDAAGNIGPVSATFTFTVDTSIPVAGVIDAISDDAGNPPTVIVNGGASNDVTPTLTGRAEAGAQVSIYDGPTLLDTVTADISGNWTFTPTTRPEGANVFTVIVTDAAGNQSLPSTSYTVTIDTTVPLLAINPSDGTTISGTTEANARVDVSIGGGPVITVTADANGNWVLIPGSTLAPNTTISAVAIDPAGNVSTTANATVVPGVDSTPPPVPILTSVVDDVLPVTVTLTSGAATNDTLPLLSGTSAEANVTITLYDNGVIAGTTTADGAGNWSLTPALALSQGAHNLTITATDANGNESAPTPVFALTVDTQAPGLTLLPSDGNILSGTTEAGATVSIDLGNDGSIDATVTADASGNWSYTPTTRLADGLTVGVHAADAAGNSSGANLTLTVDAAGPASLISSILDDVGPQIGAVLSGGATNDTIPVLSGTTEVGATIVIYDNGVAIGNGTVDGSGNWTFTPSAPLSAGAHVFTTVATDALGNVGPTSSAYTVTVDVTAPAVPSIVGVIDNVGAITGTLLSGAISDDTTPTLTGSAEAGATVTIFNNGVSIGTAIADTLGAWTFTPASPLSAGTYNLTVGATDAAGNASGPSASFTLGIDTTAPAAPVIASILDDAGSILGVVPNGGATDDALPALTGTAEAGATLTIRDNGVIVGTVTATPAGTWSFIPSSALAEGSHSFTVTATDAAGNVGAASPAYTIGIDLTPPATPVVGSIADDVGTILTPIVNGTITDDNLPALSGTAEANTRISVYDNGVLLGVTTANSGGAWTFTPSAPLAQGAHSITVTATDAVGNASLPSAAIGFTVDTTAPVAPVLASVTDDIGSLTGALTSAGVTDDVLPTLAGTAEAGATVSIYDNGTLIGSALANGSGGWSFTPGVALTEGNHSITLRATDSAGNQGPASTAFTLRVDTTAPGATAISSVIDDVGSVVGTIVNGAVTNDVNPLIRGSAEAGATVSVFNNGVLMGTTIADGSGAWSFSPSTALGEGVHAFTALATDAAGNSGSLSPAFSITIDTTPPPVPAITTITDDVAPALGTILNGGVTNDVSPLLAGTAAANTTIQIYDNGALIGSTVANGLGLWTFTPPIALANGAHSFTAATVDVAGNASSPSAAIGITVDTAPPTASIAITALTQDTGTVGDWITLDNSPTISGTLSTPLAAGEQVEIRIDGGSWVSATASGNSWFYGPGTLSVGSHAVSVRLVDAAGNIGNGASQTISIINTNQAPIVQANSNALLGLVGASALGLIDLGSQALTAFDPNNNLKSVQIRYAPLLSVNLGAFTLTASAALAAELGLQISIVNNAGLLGIVAPSSTLTITSTTANGPISNLAINELLNTVHFEQNLTLLGLDVLSATTITATDTNNLTASAATGTLLDLSLLNSSGSGGLLEGNASANTIIGTSANERLYGHDGNDILHGGDGDDLLRGGNGADQLYGEGGNDVLVYDAADTMIDGGAGSDTLLIDKGTGPVLNLDTATNIRNIERIDLGVGDAGRQLTLAEAGVLRATDANHQLIVTGDNNDSVTMTGAVYQGQTLISGQAFDHYALGTTNIFVEDPVLVVT